MKFLAISTVLFMTLTSTLALPTLEANDTPTLTSRSKSEPVPGVGTNYDPYACRDTGTCKRAEAAMPKSSSPASAPATPPKAGASGGNATAACSNEVKALAAGIQSNIDDQNNELTTVNALGMVLAQNPMDVTLYGATQTSLMGFVTKGILIRENNQKLAPAGNSAIDGLAIVANAQKEELNLTMSLALPASGQINMSQANETVETLKKDFAGGIEQNKKNLQAATSGCKAN